ncbi:hypothetical protein BVY03_01340, partial [bacterium K02(2017)]
MGELRRIQFKKKGDFELWQNYIQTNDEAHCSDLGAWRLLYQELYGIDDYSYVYLQDDKILGVVSLYHIKSKLMGNMLVSCPYFGYGGLYADNQQIKSILLNHVSELAKSLGVDYIEFRLNHALNTPYQVNSGFMEYDLFTNKSSDQIWKESLSSNVRQNIRKSEKAGLNFKITTEIDGIYDLLSKTIRAHGTPFHSKKYF